MLSIINPIRQLVTTYAILSSKGYEMQLLVAISSNLANSVTSLQRHSGRLDSRIRSPSSVQTSEESNNRQTTRWLQPLTLFVNFIIYIFFCIIFPLKLVLLFEL